MPTNNGCIFSVFRVGFFESHMVPSVVKNFIRKLFTAVILLLILFTLRIGIPAAEARVYVADQHEEQTDPD